MTRESTSDSVDITVWDPEEPVVYTLSGGDSSFEYWSHAASILPVEEWPLFAFRRRAYARRGFHWHAEPTRAIEEVRRRLADDGPLTTTDLGGAKRGGEWWDWSEAKIAVELLKEIRHRLGFLLDVGLEYLTLERATAWMERRGRWLLLLAWVPVVGDPLTFAAGVMRMP